MKGYSGHVENVSGKGTVGIELLLRLKNMRYFLYLQVHRVASATGVYQALRLEDKLTRLYVKKLIAFGKDIFMAETHSPWGTIHSQDHA